MLSSGMSFRRFLLPYLYGGIIISGVLYISNHYIIPVANKDRLKFEEKYLWDKAYSKDDNMHIRISPTEYVYLQSYNPESLTGYRFSYEEIIGTSIRRKISADRCMYDSLMRRWKLMDAVVHTFDSLKERRTKHAVHYLPIKLLPTDLVERREGKQMMTASQLDRFIQKETEKGSENLNEYYIEKYRRTAAAFSTLILTLMGASIASRKVRGGSGVHLAIGLLLSAVYVVSMQFTTTFPPKAI
jgi:Predicted permeases